MNKRAINLRNFTQKIEPTIGTKVTYISYPFKKEHGIIKSISDENHVFVVYNCAGEWDNYQDYTGARTDVSYLRNGWI